MVRDRVLLEVEFNGVKSDAVSLIATPAAVAVLPSVVNADGTLNSQVNPTAHGSVVTIWAAGLGYTDPPGVDGELAPLPLGRPLLPVSVSGADMEVLYVGNAFGIVEGVTQINVTVQLPNELAGYRQLTLSAGPDSSTLPLYIK